MQQHQQGSGEKNNIFSDVSWSFEPQRCSDKDWGRICMLEPWKHPCDIALDSCVTHNKSSPIWESPTDKTFILSIVLYAVWFTTFLTGGPNIKISTFLIELMSSILIQVVVDPLRSIKSESAHGKREEGGSISIYCEMTCFTYLSLFFCSTSSWPVFFWY